MSNPELALYCQAILDRRIAIANAGPPIGRTELVSPYTDDSVTTESLALARKKEILQYRKASYPKQTGQYYRAVMGFSQRIPGVCIDED